MEKDTLKKANKFVGIDLAKRTFQAVRVSEDSKPEWFKGKTDNTKIHLLLRWLKADDTVILEAGSRAFSLAKLIEKKAGCRVHVLNPGKLKTIYASLKKTDREDALKLAKIAQRNPEDELPIVPVPSDKQEYYRRLSTEQTHVSEMYTMVINRLNALLAQAGFTETPKRALKNPKYREEQISKLPEIYQSESRRLNDSLYFFEMKQSEIESEIKTALCENQSYVKLIMSMPGIGPITALSFLGYIGDASRFSDKKQISYYSGLVPRVDSSGESVYYGRIVKTGCRSIKRVIIQGAWALSKSKYGGPLQEFYQNLKSRKGSKKAVVALARKMVEVLYTMIKTGELYRTMPDEVLNLKLKGYGLI